MVGWHHWLNGHELEQTPEDSEGQGSLTCCSLWGHRVNTTKQLENNNRHGSCIVEFPSPAQPLQGRGGWCLPNSHIHKQSSIISQSQRQQTPGCFWSHFYSQTSVFLRIESLWSPDVTHPSRPLSTELAHPTQGSISPGKSHLPTIHRAFKMTRLLVVDLPNQYYGEKLCLLSFKIWFCGTFFPPRGQKMVKLLVQVTY